MTSGITVREAAAKTGLSVHTLRYYERIGLVWDITRDTAGHRRYSARDLDWLVLLTRLRATGLPIADMLRYAALVRAGRGVRDRLDLLTAHRARVTAQIAELTADLALIDHKIAIYREQVHADGAPRAADGPPRPREEEPA